MLNKIQQHIVSFTLALLAIAGCAMTASAQSLHTLTMKNYTGYAIYAIHMSSANDIWWEDDLLKNQILWNGYSFTVTGIPNGVYDIQLLDQDADVCTIHQVRVDQNTTWNLTTSWLLGCEFR
jgi:hypothetical protein